MIRTEAQTTQGEAQPLSYRAYPSFSSAQPSWTRLICSPRRKVKKTILPAALPQQPLGCSFPRDESGMGRPIADLERLGRIHRSVSSIYWLSYRGLHKGWLGIIIVGCVHWRRCVSSGAAWRRLVLAGGGQWTMMIWYPSSCSMWTEGVDGVAVVIFNVMLVWCCWRELNDDCWCCWWLLYGLPRFWPWTRGMVRSVYGTVWV